MRNETIIIIIKHGYKLYNKHHQQQICEQQQQQQIFFYSYQTHFHLLFFLEIVLFFVHSTRLSVTPSSSLTSSNVINYDQKKRSNSRKTFIWHPWFILQVNKKKILHSVPIWIEIFFCFCNIHTPHTHTHTIIIIMMMGTTSTVIGIQAFE